MIDCYGPLLQATTNIETQRFPLKVGIYYKLEKKYKGSKSSKVVASHSVSLCVSLPPHQGRQKFYRVKRPGEPHYTGDCHEQDLGRENHKR